MNRLHKTNFEEQKDFDLEQSRQYWKYAPTAVGDKVDTAELLRMNDQAFLENWQNHFNQLLIYYWEDKHFMQYFCRLFKGKSILSFGSGIGNNEIEFLRHDVTVTCADIVQSNLEVIQRVAQLKNLENLHCLFMQDSSETDFGGPYDYIFVRGSIMHMPFPLQKKVMQNFRKALKPGGQIILMVYTPKFVEDTCGDFSPKKFARASDPSVGDCHNPWSEWYDDERMAALAGEDFVITRKQVWNQDYYVWYSLQLREEIPAQEIELLQTEIPEFLDVKAEEEKHQTVLLEIRPDTMEIIESKGQPNADGSLHVTTTRNQFFYSLLSKVYSSSKYKNDLDGISIDITIEQGAVSLGILDVPNDKLILSRPILSHGRNLHFFATPSGEFPSQFRVILSNFQPKAEDISIYIVHRITLVHRD